MAEQTRAGGTAEHAPDSSPAPTHKPSPGPAREPSHREVTIRTAWPDLRLLLVFVIVGILGLVLASIARNTTVAFDEDVRAALDGVPHDIIRVALDALQVAALTVMVVVPVVLLVRRRPGLVMRGAIAGVVGVLAFYALGSLDFVHTHLESLDQVAKVADLTRGPSSAVIAGTAAIVASVHPVVSRTWLTTMWSAVGLLAVLRTLVAPQAPLDVLLAIGMGGVAGCLVLLAFGRSVQVLTARGVAEALDAVALPVTVGLSSTPQGPWAFEARTAEGAELLVRVVDEREWQRERFQRAYRRMRLRGTGDETAHQSPARAVVNEAMVTLLAGDRGVRVPRVRAMARASAGQAILAVDRIDATPLDELPPDQLTAEVLRGAWEQVVELHATRIAHRELTVRHLVLDGAGQVWITNLAQGEAGAEDAPLVRDVAELLASTYAQVGAERAVAGALAVLGPERLMDAVRRLVPVALTPATRAAVKSAGGLEPLVSAASSATGLEAQDFVDVERFKPRTLLVAAALAVAVYFLAPQVAEVPKMISALRDAEWGWIPLIVAASLATYIGSGLGLHGGTPGRVPAAEAGAVALAGSFVATFSPPGVSTVALNVRFLQKRGFPVSVAVSASAAKEAAVVVMHMMLLLVFALWAGSTGVLHDEFAKLASMHWVLLVAAIVVALVLGGMAIPRLRSLVVGKVVPAVREAWVAMKPIARQPLKILTLLGGVTLVPLGNGICLWASVRAFDSSADLAVVVLISLTAGSVAAAAPTPGGIGAVEAVLLASLTAVGIPAAPALTGVLVFRLATFWLPILPGFVAFRVMTARHVL